ncbi:MAG: GTPase [Pirellulales bacterium]
MRLDLDRTIVAVSSPLAAAQRAVVRLSGKQTVEILQVVLKDSPQLDQALGARRPTRFEAAFDLGWCDRWISLAVYLWPDQRSFTGETCAELHFLGSPPLVQRVLRRLTHSGASPAERGEFALRAFLAGKLDLVQAEAILGVIESNGSEQLNWALEQLAGNISGPVRQLRGELMEILAHLEAGLDFVEEDIEFISHQELSNKLRAIQDRVDGLSQLLGSRGATNRELQVALVGQPNAGKSSLFNALLGSGRAIVSDEAGTTRDIVSALLMVRDLPIVLLDTAGVESIDDQSPRALAQKLLNFRLQSCDAVLICVDMEFGGVSESLSQLNRLGVDQLPRILVGTKLDQQPVVQAEFDICVSVHDPATLNELCDRLYELASTQLQGKFTQATHHTAVRCFESLQRAGESLKRARQLVDDDEGEELIASELHCVLDDLSSIIGEVHNDDILGEIFSRFCIGK